MNAETLSALGITEDDVLNKLTEKMCEHFLSDPGDYANEFEGRINKAVTEKVDKILGEAMEIHILPNVAKQVTEITLQQTNRWGEKTGKPVTFIEYLTERVDAYIREEVNHNGKTQDQDSYSWRKHSTRIAYMIHEHLQYSIDAAMKKALGDANSSIRKGLEEAVKIALAQIKVEVNTKVSS